MNRKAINCSMECLNSVAPIKKSLVRVRSCAAGLDSFSSHPTKVSSIFFVQSFITCIKNYSNCVMALQILLKDGFTGSLLSIYDDQFSASLDELTE